MIETVEELIDELLNKENFKKRVYIDMGEDKIASITYVEKFGEEVVLIHFDDWRIAGLNTADESDSCQNGDADVRGEE